MQYLRKSATTVLLFLSLIWGCQNISVTQLPPKGKIPDLQQSKFYSNSRPWTRWWWFASEIKKQDLRDNLIWIKKNGFGGVEIAWVYPLNRMRKDTVNYTPRQKWLGQEWSTMVAYAKNCADSLDLGCDFTFGSLWPFGDAQVPREEATMNMITPSWRQDRKSTRLNSSH